MYWKEHCFGLTAETLVDKAMDLEFIGGTYSANVKPTPFICLVLKMLQLGPELDIVAEFILNEDHKYVRALGAVYLRLVGRPLDIYKYLEPLYKDYRKLRVRSVSGWSITTMDAFIDELLVGGYACNIALPRLPPRMALEDQGVIEPYQSAVSLEEAEAADEAARIAAVAEARGDAKARARARPAVNVSQGGGREVDEEAGGEGGGRRIWSLDNDGARRRPEGSRRPNNFSDARSRHGRSGVSHSTKRKRSRSRSYDRSSRRKHSPSRSRSRDLGNDHRSRRCRSRSRSRSRSRKRGEKKRRQERNGSSESVSTNAATDVDAGARPAKGTVEYWNMERAKLGLKPLQ